MNQKIFQDVFDKISDYLPEAWEKMIFYAAYTEGSYSMKFYSQNKQEKYMDCFSIPGIERNKLIRLFIDIDKILSKERMSLDDKNKWSVFTMIVDSKGNMKTEFDYNDSSEDMIAYEKMWKRKYL